MSNYTQYQDATDTTSGSSPIIWADCPTDEILHGGKGVHFFEDFLSGGDIMADAGPMGTFLDSGSTITFGDEINGAAILTEATDNEAVYIFGAPAFQITSEGGKFWFEARIKSSTITTNKQSWLVGLTDATAASEVIPLTATGVLSDHNTVGFHMQEANTTAFDTSYKANGVTAVEVNSNVGTLVADTYVKLGMKFDPSDGKLRFYINGAEQASTYSVPNATGTDFPADVALKPIIGQLLGHATSNTITVDWLRVAQMRVS